MSSRLTHIAVLASAGALTLTVALPSLAAAQSPEQGHTHRLMGSDRSAGETTDFAGIIGVLDEEKSAVGTFTAPELDCGDVDEGIDTLVELSTVGGAEYVDGALFSYCLLGEATHAPAFDVFTELGGDVLVPIEQVVENGDRIKVSSRVKGARIKVTYTNRTRGWAVSHRFSGFSPAEGSVYQYSMFLGDGDVFPPLRNADSKVTGMHVGGEQLDAADTRKFRLVDAAGTTLIRPTTIQSGTDFTFKSVP